VNRYEFDSLFHEERNIVKDGMMSVEGDYTVCVTQAAAFIKVLFGLSLTSEEKDGLRHTVFYTAQFRADLHAASRSTHTLSDDSTPSSKAALAAAGQDDHPPSSDGDEFQAADAQHDAHSPEKEANGGNVPESASKPPGLGGKTEVPGDDTPSSVGWSESLSPYRLSLYI
jgi:hypothetical protein